MGALYMVKNRLEAAFLAMNRSLSLYDTVYPLFLLDVYLSSLGLIRHLQLCSFP